jgi:predicted esterase
MTTEGQSLAGFIHRFVPAPSAQPAPTLLLLHGTGGNEHDLLDLGRMLDPTAALLSPRGQVLENGMPRFFRRFAEGVFDLDDLKLRTQALADFVAAASDVYHFNPAQVIAVGYSNGANIAASTLLLRPATLAAALLLHPMVPLVPEHLPDLSGKPVFIGAGRADPIVLPSQTEHLERLLGQAGATVSTYWHNGGHNLSIDEVRGAKGWLAEACKDILREG